MIERVLKKAAPLGLEVAGALHPEDGGTLVLLMAAPDFWEILQKAPEFVGPDPVDRYSERVVDELARHFNARAEFPFGGPPYAPFIKWARASERAWQSPVGMLVHDRAGLMISFRGALRFRRGLPYQVVPSVSPCKSCTGVPCRTACPVDALSAETGYDVDACHRHLDTEAGRVCMEGGCLARRACPVSQRFGRDPAQSAHHMAAFHRR